MANAPTLGIVENVGPNNMQSLLRQRVPGASSLDIAVAFVTATGLESILYLLERVAAKGQVRFLTGLFQGVTEPQALQTLLRHQEQTKGRISVSISTDPHFHWKSYFILKRSQATVIIGSSNLTSDGLRTSGELNVVVALQKSSKDFREFHRVFEDEWQGAKPLQAIHIARYQKQRGRNARPPTNSIRIREILKGTVKRTPSITNKKYWRDHIDGFMLQKTEDHLRKTTNWDAKGYGYFSTGGTKYNIGDRIILFDFTDKWLRVLEVVDITRTPDPTPDGRNFVAWKFVPRISKRKLNDARWKKFIEAGLLAKRSSAKSTRSISKDRYDEFVRLLRDG